MTNFELWQMSEIIVGVKNVNKSCNGQILILKGVNRMFVFYLSILVVLVTRIFFSKFHEN